MAAMEVQVASPGTIGRQQAEQRAKACWNARDCTVATLIKRERLDVHAHLIARAEICIEGLIKHESLPPADARVIGRAAKKIRAALRAMRETAEQQRAVIDEQTQSLTSSASSSRTVRT